MFKALQQFLGRKEETEMKAEATVEKPSREAIMAVYEGLRMSAYGNITVKPETESAVEFLRQKGLVAIETEFFLDPNRGVMQRKYARWIGGWSCNDCVHGGTCEKNVGKEIWYHDTSFGRRCQRFMHKAIAEMVKNGA
jgi:hypothetical protein